MCLEAKLFAAVGIFVGGYGGAADRKSDVLNWYKFLRVNKFRTARVREMDDCG